MKNRKNFYQRRPSKIARIERKCDRILSELLVIRHQLSRRNDVDASIERMHAAARRMREQCEIERDNAKAMFKSKNKDS